MSWIAPVPSPAGDPAGCAASGISATDAGLGGGGTAGEDLGHAVPFPLHAHQPEPELGDSVADQVVGRLVADVDVDDPALAAERDPRRAEPGGESSQVTVDLDGHDRPRGGDRGGARVPEQPTAV